MMEKNMFINKRDMDEKTKGFIYILITAFFWGTFEVVAKTIVSDFTPMQLAFLRFAIGSGILLPFAFYEMNQKGIRIEKKDWKNFMVLGIISVVFSMVFLQMAIKYANASIVAVLFSSNPLFAMPLAVLILKEKMNKKAIMTLILGILGLLIIINPFQQNQQVSLLGIFFGIGSAVSFALFTVAGRKMAIKYSSIIMNAFSGFLGVIILFLILLITQQPILQGINFSNILPLLYLGVGVSGIAFILYFKGIHYTSVSTGGLAFFIKPVFSFLLASVFLKEVITVNMMIGTIIIFAAFLLKYRS